MASPESIKCWNLVTNMSKAPDTPDVPVSAGGHELSMDSLIIRDDSFPKTPSPGSNSHASGSGQRVSNVLSEDSLLQIILGPQVTPDFVQKPAVAAAAPAAKSPTVALPRLNFQAFSPNKTKQDQLRDIVKNGTDERGHLTPHALQELAEKGLVPIKPIHGPASLPYARCPSGTDALLNYWPSAKQVKKGKANMNPIQIPTNKSLLKGPTFVSAQSQDRPFIPSFSNIWAPPAAAPSYTPGPYAVHLQTPPSYWQPAAPTAPAILVDPAVLYAQPSYHAQSAFIQPTFAQSMLSHSAPQAPQQLHQPPISRPALGRMTQQVNAPGPVDALFNRAKANQQVKVTSSDRNFSNMHDKENVSQVDTAQGHAHYATKSKHKRRRRRGQQA